MTPAQLRAARALANLSIRDLASESGLGEMTIIRFEAGLTVRPATVAAIMATLDAHGVELIPADEMRGAGVRFAVNDDTMPTSTERH